MTKALTIRQDQTPPTTGLTARDVFSIWLADQGELTRTVYKAAVWRGLRQDNPAAGLKAPVEGACRPIGRRGMKQSAPGELAPPQGVHPPERNPIMIAYDQIKQLAVEEGVSVNNLIALARPNDPFYRHANLTRTSRCDTIFM
jgi:hypothetical protein